MPNSHATMAPLKPMQMAIPARTIAAVGSLFQREATASSKHRD